MAANSALTARISIGSQNSPVNIPSSDLWMPAMVFGMRKSAALASLNTFHAVAESDRFAEVSLWTNKY